MTEPQAEEGMKPLSDAELTPEVADDASAEVPFDDPDEDFPDDEGGGEG